MAAHAIRAGEGDVFVAAGVETVSRFASGASDSGKATNELFSDAMERTAKRSERADEPWSAQPGLPDIYIAMGQTAENVAEYEKVSRLEMDEFAVRSQELAWPTRRTASSNERSSRHLARRHRRHKDDGPRAGTTLERLATLQPVFREGGFHHRGQRLSLERRRRGVVVMSDTRAKELGIKPLARIVSSGVSGLNPR